jgi:hypothetical protein
VRGILLGLTSLLFLLAGCGGTSVARPSWTARPGWTDWAEHAGGIARGPEQGRAEAALARLAIGSESAVSVRVLCKGDLGAWTFPDGNMFITLGLARALNDDELAAVLAHEAGHLRVAGRLPGGAAFDGNSGSVACEERADDEGGVLLKSRGIPEASLISALCKVRNANSTPAFVRVSLDARIRRLTLACRPAASLH